MATTQHGIIYIVLSESCDELVRQVDHSVCYYHSELRIYPWAPKMLDTWSIIEVYTPSPCIFILIIQLEIREFSVTFQGYLKLVICDIELSGIWVGGSGHPFP